MWMSLLRPRRDLLAGNVANRDVACPNVDHQTTALGGYVVGGMVALLSISREWTTVYHVRGFRKDARRLVFQSNPASYPGQQSCEASSLCYQQSTALSFQLFKLLGREQARQSAAASSAAGTCSKHFDAGYKVS
jgi:hypothetical protein